MNIFPVLIFFLFSIFALTACCHERQSPNHVYEYLEGAELQCETMEQKREIRQVFKDMLNLPTDQLRKKAYNNYVGLPEWPAHYVLERYFVPNSRKFLDESTFYQELDDPRVKKIIIEWLNKLQKDSMAAGFDNAMSH